MKKARDQERERERERERETERVRENVITSNVTYCHGDTSGTRLRPTAQHLNISTQYMYRHDDGTAFTWPYTEKPM